MQSTIAQKALVGQAVVAKATTRTSVRSPVVVRAQKEEAVRPGSSAAGRGLQRQREGPGYGSLSPSVLAAMRAASRRVPVTLPSPLRRPSTAVLLWACWPLPLP